jgi:phosphohistidine swiveling domain-containing protein
MTGLFTSKGGTLQKLKDLELEKSYVLPVLLMTRTQLESPKLEQTLKESFPEVLSFAIRSSFANEDSPFASNAGKFKSLLNVSRENIKEGVLDVLNSNKSPSIDDEVLIQPMLKDVILSGVALSYDRDTNNCYRIIEYTKNSDTTLVTSGNSKESITKVYWRNQNHIFNDLFIDAIAEMIEELEIIFKTDELDIEFAFQLGDPKPFLFQVRPLINKANPKSKASAISVENYLQILVSKISGKLKKHPFLVGDTTIFGVMPDWNPAEIIGIRPRPLALSLYRELITDGMWAYQRHNYGYRNLRGFPLMLDLAGQPYIDVRISFNSFIPEKLSYKIANKLVNGYIEKLNRHPALHDKVEFEIVISCLTLDFDLRIDEIKNYGLDNLEIDLFKESLKHITKNIFSNTNPIWKHDEQRVEILSSRREKILDSDLSPIDKIYWLLEDCKRYGTLPFGGLARAAFISTQMLNSMENVGLIDSNQKNLINKSIKTIASEMSFMQKTHNKEDFLNIFGHLRPGTYDITQPSYREDTSIYFPNFDKNEVSFAIKDEIFRFEDLEIDHKNVNHHLRSIGITSDSKNLFSIIMETIKLRESSKLQFTNNLSSALDILVKYGDDLGFNREDLSYLNFNSLKSLYLSGKDPKYFLAQEIAQNQDHFEISKSIWLPPLIKSKSDIYAFELIESAANFITQECVEGRISNPSTIHSINDSIILIENADPGFDWIFTSSIKGLITAYGGMNSHMAVRSGEFGLPCAIGVGQKRFNELKNANRIRLDCLNKLITILS